MKPNSNQQLFSRRYPAYKASQLGAFVAMFILGAFGVSRLAQIIGANFQDLSGSIITFISVIILFTLQVLTNSTSAGPAWLWAWQHTRVFRKEILFDKEQDFKNHKKILRIGSVIAFSSGTLLLYETINIWDLLFYGALILIVFNLIVTLLLSEVPKFIDKEGNDDLEKSESFKAHWRLAAFQLFLFIACASFEIYLDIAYVPVLSDKMIAQVKKDSIGDFSAGYEFAAEILKESESSATEAKKSKTSAAKKQPVSAREKQLRARLNQKITWNEKVQIERSLRSIESGKASAVAASIKTVEETYGVKQDSIAEAKRRLAQSLMAKIDSASTRNKMRIEKRENRVDAGAWLLRFFIISLIGFIFYTRYQEQYLILACEVEPEQAVEGFWEQSWSRIKKAVSFKFYAFIAYLLPENLEPDIVKNNVNFSKKSEKFWKNFTEKSIYPNILQYLCTANGGTGVSELVFYKHCSDMNWSNPLEAREVVKDFMNMGFIIKEGDRFKATAKTKQSDFFD